MRTVDDDVVASRPFDDDRGGMVEAGAVLAIGVDDDADGAADGGTVRIDAYSTRAVSVGDAKTRAAARHARRTP